MQAIRRTFLAKITASLLVCASIATTFSARAGESEDPKRTEEARTRFQRGVELYKDGDYRASIIEFRRAYELVQNWRIHYNIAQACGEVQDYPCALRELEAYLAQGSTEVPEDRRSAVETELRRVRSRIARVTVTVNRPSAEVFVDDQSLGPAPFKQQALVSAGRRRFVATLPGGRSVTKVVEIAGGDQLTLSLDFVDAQASPPTPNEPASEPSMTPIYVGLGVTGLFAAGAVTTGILSLGAQSDLDKAIDTIPGSKNDIDDARSRTKTFALVTDILGGAAIVAAGVTVYLIATRPSSSRRESTNVALKLGVGTVGLRGQF